MNKKVSKVNQITEKGNCFKLLPEVMDAYWVGICRPTVD